MLIFFSTSGSLFSAVSTSTLISDTATVVPAPPNKSPWTVVPGFSAGPATGISSPRIRFPIVLNSRSMNISLSASLFGSFTLKFSSWNSTGTDVIMAVSYTHLTLPTKRIV